MPGHVSGIFFLADKREVRLRQGSFKPWAQWMIGFIVLGAVAEIWLVTQICGFSQWLSNWQTLIAGMLALVGALLTVRYLRKQIVLTENMEIERRRREENAVKAVLPMALSEIVDYSTESIRLLERLAVPRGGLLGSGLTT
jgi:hypothetical protein